MHFLFILVSAGGTLRGDLHITLFPDLSQENRYDFYVTISVYATVTGVWYRDCRLLCVQSPVFRRTGNGR